MTTIEDVAQRVLDENGYDTDDISIVNLEYLINNAIDYINLEAGQSIPHVDSADLTATDAQLFMVKTLSGLMIRAYKEHGPQVGMGAISISLISTDPNFKVYWSLFQNGLDRLRGRSAERV